jgi:lysophospholipase L1-like esterase
MSWRAKQFPVLAAAAIMTVLCAAAVSRGDPLLNEGDRMVLLGDSITQQRIYTRYVMDYFALRYPELHVTFRNAGVGGDTAVGAIKRVDKDVLELKPQVVSICFGMNDAGYAQFDEERYQTFIAAMTVLLADLKRNQATVVLLTPGPVDPDKGASWLDWGMYNDVLKRYADGVGELAARKGVVVADSRSLLLDVQARAKKDDPAFTMIPDAIHPSAPGQALMAYSLLKALGCDRLPSGLTISARTGAIAADRCAVENISVSDSEIAFTRRDEALPTYLDPEVGAVLRYASALAELNRYPFTVSGLQPGNWRLSVDGTEVGVFSSEALAEGVNLTSQPGPWRTLAQEVNRLVAEQESIYLQKRQLNGIFRWIPTPPPEAEVEKLALMRKLDETVTAREHECRDLVSDRTWEWRLLRVP